MRGAAPLALPRVFVSGLMVNLLNPKVVVFMLAFLPQYARPEQGRLGLQIFVLGLLLRAHRLHADVADGCLRGAPARLSAGPAKRGRWLNYGAGGAFIASGLKVATLRHL